MEPTIDPEIICVVLAGKPRCDAAKRKCKLLVSHKPCTTTDEIIKDLFRSVLL